MKKLILVLLVSVSFSIMAAPATNTAFLLAISIPAKDGEHVLDAASGQPLYVILSNTSQVPQRVWAPWSEANRGTLSFEFRDATGITWKTKRKKWDSVSHKVSEACELQPGESLVFDIDYASEAAWTDFPKAGW